MTAFGARPVPARSPIGVALATTLALLLIVVGVVAGLTVRPLTGAHLAALLTIAAGGALLARLARVTR